MVNPINFLIIILIFLYLINKKKNILVIYKINKLIILILFIIGIFPIGNIGLKNLEKDYLIQPEIDKIENIIILGGTFRTHNSFVLDKIELSNQSERLITSIKLFIKHPNSKIYFVGGDANLVSQNKNEIDLAKIFFNEMDLDLNRIEFIPNSRNTIESFKSLNNLNIKDKKNILITSAFHMKRSMLISKKYNFNLIPYAVDFRSISTPGALNKYQYFDIVSNLGKFNLFFREILGIVAFKFFY